MSEELCCKVCDLVFPYPSRLKRHLRSRRHGLIQSACEGEDSYRLLTTEPESPMEGPNVFFYNDLIVEHDYDDKLSTASDTDIEDFSSGEELDYSGDDAPSPVLTNASDYYPYESKEAALLYILINSPRPVAERVLKFFFHILKMINPFIPSLTQIKSIILPGYVSPSKYTSEKGIPFHVILPSTIIERCLASIDVAKELRHYPISTGDGVCSELYEAARWNTDPRFQAPMTTLSDGTRLFLEDFVEIENGYGKIKKFVIEKTTNTLMCHVQCITASSGEVECYLLHDGTSSIPVSSIDYVYTSVPFRRVDVKMFASGGDGDETIITSIDDDEWEKLTAESHWKEKSGGLRVETIPLVLFSDDVSGNESRKWNKFDVWALLLAGLPRSQNSQLENIHFVTASNKLGCLQLVGPVVDDLLVLEKEGRIMYDTFYEENVLVVAPVLCCIADNPRASDLANHAGTSARKFCRMCMVDGKKHPDRLSSDRQKRQLLAQIGEVNAERMKTVKKRLRTLYGVRETENPLLQLPLDLCQSIPVECLHTLLLGAYKYLFEDLMQHITVAQKEAIRARIEAFPSSGLDLSLSKTACRYYQSFHGKDYKALAQCALFILWDELNAVQKAVWLSLSKVFQVTYCKPFQGPKDVPEIKATCEDFVTIIKTYKPSLLLKPKIHLLLHLSSNMKDFGPASCFNTERCEAFNKLLKLYNTHSNRMASSRDIATKFSKLEHLRSMCGSGRCGNGIMQLLKDPHVASFMHGTTVSSLSMKELYRPGTLRKDKKQVQKVGAIPITHNGTTITIRGIRSSDGFSWCSDHSLEMKVKIYGAVMARNGILTNVEDYVAFIRDDEVLYGQLKACFKTDCKSFCVVQMLYPVKDNSGQQIYNEQDCPLLKRSSHLCTPSSDKINSPVSIVHECVSCNLKTKRKRQTIERDVVEINNTLVLEHDFKYNNMFSLNVYCMHNN